MVVEIQGVLTAASGLVSLGIGLFVFLKGRHRLANTLFFAISACIAIWAIGEAMTLASDSLAGKTFWTRFQGVGELPLIPTYLLLAFYFPRPKAFMRGRRRAVVIIAALYAPWLLSLVLLYTTGIIYSSYFLIDQGQGIDVARTPFFWSLTALGFAKILAASCIYLQEWRRSSTDANRKGLLILALAPVPVLVANAIQNLGISSYVTTPQASLVFVSMIAYGILRYGLFIDIRSATRNLLAHAVVIAANLAAFTLLCSFYVFGLGLEQRWPLYALFVFTGIPFMLAYQAELDLARRLTDRYLYGREFEESRLLQELAHSIRTVSDLGGFAESVVERTRECMGLSACALMVSDGAGYRMVGVATEQNHPAALFAGALEEGTRMLDWGGFFSSDCLSGRFSTYWQVGEVIERAGCSMAFLRRGILRIYRGDGEVDEFRWRDEVEGEAISIPLVVRGDRVGLLWLVGRPGGDRFSLDELDFMGSLSVQVAVSLLNSRLMQELLDKSERLQALIHSASTAQEEERARISRELHDGLAPYFLDMVFRLEVLEAQMAGLPALSGSLEEIKAKAREGLRDLRRVIGDLRPSSLDVLGLERSLSTYLERFAAENGLAVEFVASGDLKDLDSLTEVTIFRVAQEALSNIARHAGAGRVRFILKGDGGWVELMVEDDGSGFAEREVMDKVARGECLGIKGMKERAELMQGDLVIDTRPGDGTRVSFAFPVTRTATGGRREK